ncbi:MAG: CHAP domain-containing protein [Candidatus Dormibacteraeota bacterium]|nr:CHAP domain-containing protein [Candidatus Dormibacteraeota bacterium]
MRGARIIRHASLALAMASAVWVSAVMGPGPAASAKQGTATNSAQLTNLLNELKAEGDLTAQGKVKALLVKVEAEQSYLQQLNQRLASDQETAAVLQQQMAGDRNALTNLVSTAYVDGNGSQAVADALAAPSLSQFLSSTTLPAAIASQVAALVGNMQKDQRVVSTDTSQLMADESQAMVVQQELGTQSAQLLSSLSNPQPALGSGSWSFAYGDCTWYVATQRKVTWGGNAYQWWANAAAAGYAEGQTPQVGSIVVWGQDVPGYSYGYGHVAYVQAVQGNQFEVSEMNFSAPGGGWDRVDYRWVADGAGYLGFIYGQR